MKRTSNLYSIIGISLVLFLLGTIGWMFINGNALSRYFKENIQLQIIMHDNTRAEKAQALEQILQQQHFVSKVHYTSKEEAYEKFMIEKGEDPMADGLLKENPLYISIDVNLKADYVHPDSISKVIAFIQQSNIVREVVYDQPLVDTLQKKLKNIGLILGGIAIVLFIAVVIIIDNTVRLAMFSNRMLIKTMQMVGATRWFIAKPFNTQAFISGMISGIIAVIGLFLLRYGTAQWMPEINALTTSVHFYILCAIIIGLGIFISVFSTHRSVFKYLKLKVDKLY